jgi:hypothetical protein
MREKKAANNTTNNVACGKGNIDVECLEFGKASCFEKDDRISKDCISAKDLCRPDYAVLERTGVSTIFRSNIW